MSVNVEALIFWLFALLAVAGAIAMITRKNAVTAVMCLVGTILATAALYVMLYAHFLAAIQVLVYAGAVMVLFLFVIMLLNLDTTAGDLRGSLSIGGAVAVAGLLVVELGALWSYTPERLAADLRPAGAAAAFPQAIAAGAESSNIVLDVARPLFGAYLIPFEVTSVLLLAAVVGAVVLAKRRI